jgi:hypothetical protein
LIEIKITNEQIKRAEEKSIEMGALEASITGGGGNIAGFLGEILFVDYFGGVVQNTYDYDVIIEGFKVDVKTKRTTVKPEKHYLATVADFNTKQKCDIYYFVRVDIEKKLGFLLGGLKKSEFYKNATFNKKGEIDPSSDRGWTFKADCYNIEISKLKQSKRSHSSMDQST